MKKILILILILLIQYVLPAQKGRVKIAVVKKKNLKEYNTVVRSFRNHLAKSGYTIEIKEFLFYNLKIAKGISSFEPDMLFTLGTSVTKLVSEEFQEIPLVYAMVVDPEGSGVKGRNVAGVTLDMPEEDQFRIIKNVLPQVRTGGVFYTPSENRKNIIRAEKVATENNLALRCLPLPAGGELPYDQLSRVDFIWVIPDTQVCRGSVIRKLLLSGLKDMTPVVGISPMYAKAGALLSISCNYEDIGVQAGELAVSIIEGSNPGELNIRKPRKFEFFINASVASRLKIDIPEKVIEEASGVFGR